MSLPGDWRHLLAGCDPAQVEAITTPASPLLVVAGAGSGKTRVLTRRIAWRVAHGTAVARHVLALTFTRKAAGELRARLAGLGLPAPVTAGTFHAVALAQLRRRALDAGRQAPVLLERKARLLVPILEPGGPAGAAARHLKERRDLARAIAGEIEWAKGRRLLPAAYAAAAREAARPGPLAPETTAEVYRAYEAERRRRGLLDFDDLLGELLGALEQDPSFAAAQRWQFAHVFVDELQDATTLQLRLVEAWLGGRDDLCAVGDPRQSVYAWNGADPSAVIGFATRHPGASVVELATNYRSSPQVVAVASAALDGAHPGASACPDGPLPSFRSYPDDAAEAAGVAGALRLAHRPGRPWSACAVLARTNAQLEPVAAALEGAGIPVARRNLRRLLDTPAAREALRGLPAGNDPTRLSAHLAEHLEAFPEDDEDRPVLQLLAELADDYVALEASGSRDGFVSFLDATAREGAAPRRDAVELATFHRAKGLEWEVVAVIGLEDGFVPIRRAATAAALEEERRLLYVALSRATSELHVSWAARRRFGERQLDREPSPYLPALEAARRRLEHLAVADPRTAAAALAASRAALAGAAETGPAARTARG